MNFPAGRKIRMLAVNITAAAVRSAAHVARTGHPFATESEIARRAEACRACETWVEATDRCSLERGGCGCFLRLKRKLAAERCPLARW